MADPDRPPGLLPPTAPASENPVSQVQLRFERMLGRSRLLILVPVIFLLVDAAGSFFYGCVIFIRTLLDVLRPHAEISTVTGRFLVVMDTYRVGATLLISAFGFYFLFIGRDTSPHALYLPSWLRMHDLEDLKARVVSMLILVAAITFVDVVIETRDEQGAFWLGLGIAVVIGALTAFLRFGRQAHQRTPGGSAATPVADGGTPAGSAELTEDAMPETGGQGAS
jgi:uncharacterized membrane protein YqhA